MRYALALDLVDDAERIAQYEKEHVKIWPEVRDHLLAHGVLAMQIYRLGTRLFMMMDVDDAVYNIHAEALAAKTNPAVVRWEAFMWAFQAPTPWTPGGVKWTAMQCIFDLSAQ